jgi:precorrin-2 dehydrogenase/sirohydrochlorin ferrochelatase
MSLPDHMRVMIPLIIDFTGKKVVIFGGGEVATRKAAYFRDGEMVVVSRSFSKDLVSLPVERQKMDLREVSDDKICTLIRGAFLVIAATSTEGINNRIGNCCRQERVLFNNAAGDPGDVILPAILKGKNFLIAVETYGRSPAFSRYLRSRLEYSRDSFDHMIELQERLRLVLKNSTRSQMERRTMLEAVVGDPLIWEALEHDLSAAWNLVEKRYLA